MSPRKYPVLSARELVRRLGRHFGYQVVRQRGSHIRLRTQQEGEHSITIPDHNPLRLGTVSGIVRDVAEHFHLEEDEVITKLRTRR